MVETGEAGDVLGRDGGCILLQDQRICIGRIGHHQHLPRIHLISKSMHSLINHKSHSLIMHKLMSQHSTLTHLSSETQHCFMPSVTISIASFPHVTLSLAFCSQAMFSTAFCSHVTLTHDPCSCSHSRMALPSREDETHLDAWFGILLKC